MYVYKTKLCAVFPGIVSAETIIFLIWPYVLYLYVTVHKSAETIQGRKLFKGVNYSRKYGIYNIIFATFINLNKILLKITIKVQKIMNSKLPNWPKASQILDYVSYTGPTAGTLVEGVWDTKCSPA